MFFSVLKVFIKDKIHLTHTIKISIQVKVKCSVARMQEFGCIEALYHRIEKAGIT